MPNVTITPHAAGETVLSRRRADAIFTDNLGRYVRGEALRNEVALRLGPLNCCHTIHASVGSPRTSPNRAAFRVLGGPAMGEPVAPVVVCWSVKGGSGTTVVAAAWPCCPPITSPRCSSTSPATAPSRSALANRPARAITEWLRSPNADADALARLAVQVGEGLALIPRGGQPLGTDEPWEQLAAALGECAPVVVDAGTGAPPARARRRWRAVAARHPPVLHRPAPSHTGRSAGRPASSSSASRADRCALATSSTRSASVWSPRWTSIRRWPAPSMLGSSCPGCHVR